VAIIQHRIAGRRFLVDAAIAVLAIALGAVLLSPFLSYPFGRDHGVFATAADILSRGGVPYLNIWDVKPPGIFYLYQASFSLFGRSMAAPRILDLIWTLATATAVYVLGRRLFRHWTAIAAAVFFLVRYVAGFGYWNSAQPDGFASLPLSLAAMALLTAEHRRSLWVASLAGTLTGVAMLLKPTLGIFILMPVIAAMTNPQDSVGTRVGRASIYIIGCFLVIGGAVLLIWQAGALRDTNAILIQWNLAYSHLRHPLAQASNPIIQTSRFIFGLPRHYLFPVGLLAIIGAFDLLTRPNSGRMRGLTLGWTLSMMASVWLQGKFYTYHWLPVLPPFALLAAQGLDAIKVGLRQNFPQRAARAIAISGASMLIALLGLAYWSSLQWPIRVLLKVTGPNAVVERFGRRGDFSLAADAAVASSIKGGTEPSDSIFVWGFEPLIYFLADRRPASRFIYNVPLVTPWSPAEWRSELLDDLQTKRPAYFIVTRNDRLPG